MDSANHATASPELQEPLFTVVREALESLGSEAFNADDRVGGEIANEALAALEEIRALLKEAWEFDEYPGPGEGLVSTEDDYPAQESWRARWDALDDRIKLALGR